MFYAHFVLAKKGPLARIWLAAHWDKKLTKAHVFETNIDSSVEAIIEPKVKMALRTSGHLLLGVVRIYSRKAKYLLADCNEAFVKIKMAFRPGVVDLPEENREAAVATITLPETFHDFDTTMADLGDIDVQAQFSVNQSRPEEITMREDLGNITLVGDDGFGDMGFGDQGMLPDTPMDDSLYKAADSSNLLMNSSGPKNASSDKPMDINFEASGPVDNDDFGGDLDDFEPAGVDDDDDDGDFGGAVDDELFGDNFMSGTGLFEEPPVPEVAMTSDGAEPAKPDLSLPSTSAIGGAMSSTTVVQEQTTMVPDQTTLVPNEDEAFALEPLDITAIGTERRHRRKRKLIVDEQKGIQSETMKLQLSDTSEIVTTLDLAPPTKKLMHWKETGGVEKLFALPGRNIPSKRIGRYFVRNLTTRPLSLEDVEEPEEDRLELEVPRDEDSRHGDDAASLVEQASRLEADLSRQSLPAPDMSRQSIQPVDSSIRAGSSDSFAPLPDDSALDHLQLDMPALPPEMNFQQPDSPDVDPDDLFSMDLPEDGPPSNKSEEDEEKESLPEEEVEERRWNKRTQHLLHMLEKSMGSSGQQTTFTDVVHRNHRKQVASKFYTLLVLKKQQAIEVQQSRPYGEIYISRGPKFIAGF